MQVFRIDNIVFLTLIIRYFLLLVVAIAQVVIILPKLRKALRKRRKKNTSEASTGLSNLKELLIEYIFCREMLAKDLKEIEASRKQAIFLELSLFWNICCVAPIQIIFANLITSFGKWLSNLGISLLPKKHHNSRIIRK